MRRIKKCLVVAVVAGMLAVPLANGAHVLAVSQGTDGTEIQVMEPETLEIQLGAEWAGTAFQLKTDAGLYPDEIMVGEDGVLRMEIGGSKSYILTCLSADLSTDVTVQSSTAEETGKEDASVSEEGIVSGSGAKQESPSQETETAETGTGSAVQLNDQVNTVAGIPLKHLLLFSFGMVAAVGTLITIHIVQRRQEEWDVGDEEEE